MWRFSSLPAAPRTVEIIDMTPIRGTTITRMVLMVIRMGIMAPVIRAGGIAGDSHGKIWKLLKEAMVYEDKTSSGSDACGCSGVGQLRGVHSQLLPGLPILRLL